MESATHPTEGGAFTFATLLQKTYSFDGNFWDSDQDSTWKVRSPVDPRVRPALIAGSDIHSPPRGLLSGIPKPLVPTTFSRSRSASVRRADDEETVFTDLVAGEGDSQATEDNAIQQAIAQQYFAPPSLLVETPEEIAARAEVPPAAHAIVDDSEASSVDDLGLPDVSGL